MGICALMCVPMAENKLLTQYLKLVANILVCVYKQYFMLIYAFVWCTHICTHKYVYSPEFHTFIFTYECVLVQSSAKSLSLHLFAKFILIIQFNVPSLIDSVSILLFFSKSEFIWGLIILSYRYFVLT